MNYKNKMLTVKDSTELAQGGLQVDLLEGGVGGLLDRIIEHQVSL